MKIIMIIKMIIKNSMICYILGIVALNSSSESGINYRDKLFQVLLAVG